MKRRDYILIAEALKRAADAVYSNTFPCAGQVYTITAGAMADALQADNPNGFDREMFLQNAGVTER